MNKKILFSIILLTVIFISGCAENHYVNVYEPVGFFSGLRDWLTVRIAFIVSWFNSDITLYDAGNNGFWYNLWYILGVTITLGWTGAATRY